MLTPALQVARSHSLTQAGLSRCQLTVVEDDSEGNFVLQYYKPKMTESQVTSPAPAPQASGQHILPEQNVPSGQQYF